MFFACKYKKMFLDVYFLNEVVTLGESKSEKSFFQINF